MTKRTCTIDGCKKPHLARGWCNSHYMKWYETGDPFATGRGRACSTPELALEARTRHGDGCAVWTGTVSALGYGAIWNGEKTVPVHRYAWERTHGPIPDGAEIDHICHNRACVKLSHLRLAGRGQNMRNLSGAHSTNRLGVRNVSRTREGKFLVRVTKFGTTHYFGTYGALEDAAMVAERERARLFGEFAGKP